MAVAAPLLTLGDQVADWIETMLVFASADHRGDPFVLDDDEVRVLQSAYEVRPHGRRCWPRVDPGGVGVGELEGGLRSSFVVADERFLWTSVEARRLFMTLRTNLSKRPHAQPWLLEGRVPGAARS
jgi:hypothetical protein